jgi:hypothetical protein
MTETELYWIIQSIDKQISKINPYSNWMDTVAIPLLELRNNVLRKYYPEIISTEIDWRIKEPQALKILKRLNWTVKYE